jgi:PIN domain nuclease of toxin-antitoxin system
MTDRLLLDTHIALWRDSGDDRLRIASRAPIEGCWRNGGTILVSAITAWEIELLVDTGRIDLDIAIEAWFERFVGRPGIAVVPLSYRTACRSYRLQHLEHRDRADRLLIATAIELTCPLVTYDQRIAGFAKRHGGFAVSV